MEFLVQELNGKRPLLPPDLPMSPEVNLRPPKMLFSCAWLTELGWAGTEAHWGPVLKWAAVCPQQARAEQCTCCECSLAWVGTAHLVTLLRRPLAMTMRRWRMWWARSACWRSCRPTAWAPTSSP